MNPKYPHSGIAQALASKGRNGDSELLHVTPDEIQGLHSVAHKMGAKMTRNPHTGIYEASWLSKATGIHNKDLRKVRDTAETALSAATLGATKGLMSKGSQQQFQKLKDKYGPMFTKLRDAAEDAAVLVANYYLPGSSLLTKGLTSKNAQKFLNSGLGQVLNIASGGIGGIQGNMGNYGRLFNAGRDAMGLGSAANAAGTASGVGGTALGTDLSGLSDVAVKTGLPLGSSAASGVGTLDPGVLESLGISPGSMVNAGASGSGLTNAAINTAAGASSPGILGALKDFGTSVLNDPKKLMELGKTGYKIYSALNQPSGGGAGGVGGYGSGIGQIAPPQFYNTQLQQTVNPKFGQPGEPYFISQGFTPGSFSSQYQAPQGYAAGGLMSGGLMYSDGELVGGGAPVYAAGGSVGYYKAGGKLLDGPGDGMSDSIPAEIQGQHPQRAALADGEFVVPADVVSHLGNGSTKAGAKVLYSMMHKIRKARTGNPKQGKQINPHKFVPA
jgi:hypothetical protein